MRRFRRRGKPAVAWLPVFGNSLAPESADLVGGYDNEEMDISTGGLISTDYLPLTFDASDSPEAQQVLGTSSDTLRDFVSGQVYRLRRIVGSVQCAWGSLPQNASATNLTSIIVGAAFIVLRTNTQGVPLNEVSPLRQDHQSFPWIWHRTWVLGKNFIDNAFLANAQWNPDIAYPSRNVDFARGRNDEFDQKTARVIADDSRLFFVISARMNGFNVALPPVGARLIYNLHYRLLGSLRGGTQGNRRNATR